MTLEERPGFIYQNTKSKYIYKFIYPWDNTIGIYVWSGFTWNFYKEAEPSDIEYMLSLGMSPDYTNGPFSETKQNEPKCIHNYQTLDRLERYKDTGIIAIEYRFFCTKCLSIRVKIEGK